MVQTKSSILLFILAAAVIAPIFARPLPADDEPESFDDLFGQKFLTSHPLALADRRSQSPIDRHGQPQDTSHSNTLIPLYDPSSWLDPNLFRDNLSPSPNPSHDDGHPTQRHDQNLHPSREQGEETRQQPPNEETTPVTDKRGSEPLAERTSLKRGRVDSEQISPLTAHQEQHEMQPFFSASEETRLAKRPRVDSPERIPGPSQPIHPPTKKHLGKGSTSKHASKRPRSKSPEQSRKVRSRVTMFKRRHEHINNPKAKHQCTRGCNAKFMHHNDRIEHERTHDLPKQPGYRNELTGRWTCDINKKCTRDFKNSNAMNRHQRVNFHKDTKYKCSHSESNCAVVLPDPESLRRHRETTGHNRHPFIIEKADSASESDSDSHSSHQGHPASGSVSAAKEKGKERRNTINISPEHPATDPGSHLTHQGHPASMNISPEHSASDSGSHPTHQGHPASINPVSGSGSHPTTHQGNPASGSVPKELSSKAKGKQKQTSESEPAAERKQTSEPPNSGVYTPFHAFSVSGPKPGPAKSVKPTEILHQKQGPSGPSSNQHPAPQGKKG